MPPLKGLKHKLCGELSRDAFARYARSLHPGILTFVATRLECRRTKTASSRPVQIVNPQFVEALLAQDHGEMGTMMHSVQKRLPQHFRLVAFTLEKPRSLTASHSDWSRFVDELREFALRVVGHAE